LNVNLGHNPSYTWRSLWSTQSLLSLGYRWKIGDGSNINVWSMPWIRNFPSLKPSPPPPPHYEELSVNALLNPGLNSWNNTLVHSLFNATDAAAILSIPLYARTRTDVRVWKATVDGAYSVKSAYRTCSDLLLATTPVQNNVCWNSIWNIKIPPQIRSFMWRLAHQCLPTRVNLLTRGIPCEESCVCCDLLAETHMHVFFVCSKAVNCWEHIGIHNIILELLPTADNFTTMLFDLLNRLSPHQQSLTAMVLWSLWKNRNSKLWEAIDHTSSFIVTRAKDTLNEWSCMQRAKLPAHNAEHPPKWSKPPVGIIKRNVDAASLNNDSIKGYGMRFRDSSGLFMLGKSDYYYSSTTILESETIGLLEAIKVTISKGMHVVWVETDRKAISDALATTNIPQNEFGDIISQCKSLLINRTDFVVLHIRLLIVSLELPYLTLAPIFLILYQLLCTH